MPDTARIFVRLAVLFACAAGLAALAWSLATGRITVPPRWNPWAPLDIAEAPGPFTSTKLARLTSGPPAACLAWLDRSGVRHTPVADRTERDGCGWQGATRLSAFGEARLSSAVTLSCPVAAGLALWERHALQPAAFVQMGSRVATIEHLGSYACRNVGGGATGRRSEHARANALDVAGFRLADGRQVSVLRDWRAAGATRSTGASLFLGEAQQGACGYFSAVLSPAYNAAHRDHFHLDRGPYRVCR